MIKYGLLFILLLTNCGMPAQKAGYYDPNNKSTEPYLFIFKGTTKNASIALKRTLILNGFSIATDDLESGIIITDPKILKDDETIWSGGMAFALTAGGASIKEKGVIAFIFNPIEPELIEISMKCTIQSDESRDTIFGRQNTSRERILTQGEPLSMKMKSKLILSKNFILK